MSTTRRVPRQLKSPENTRFCQQPPGQQQLVPTGAVWPGAGRGSGLGRGGAGAVDRRFVEGQLRENLLDRIQCLPVGERSCMAAVNDGERFLEPQARINWPRGSLAYDV